MTLLHLATHTSGLPPELETTVEAEAGGLSRDALFELVAKSPPAAAGSVYASKAIDGALVAELLAARAQSTYEAMLKQRVLDPLGMQDTGVAVTDEMVGRLATGFGGAAMVVEPVVFDAMAGGIGVRSTCDDMLTFAAANLDPSSSSIGPTLRAAKSPKVRKLAGGKAGLFWHVYPGGKAVRSVGQGRGFSAAIFVNERLGVAVVVLAATDDGSAVWSAVRSVMDTYKPAAADDE
jgi:CubicO group peptidase (beta-lactamase class C family)